MRTTITLDDESLVVIESLRRRENMGLSEAANALIRRGAVNTESSYRPPRQSFHMEAKASVRKTSEVLELLEREGL